MRKLLSIALLVITVSSPAFARGHGGHSHRSGGSHHRSARI